MAIAILTPIGPGGEQLNPLVLPDNPEPPWILAAAIAAHLGVRLLAMWGQELGLLVPSNARRW